VGRVGVGSGRVPLPLSPKHCWLDAACSSCAHFFERERESERERERERERGCVPHSPIPSARPNNRTLVSPPRLCADSEANVQNAVAFLDNLVKVRVRLLPLVVGARAAAFLTNASCCASWLPPETCADLIKLAPHPKPKPQTPNPNPSPNPQSQPHPQPNRTLSPPAPSSALTHSSPSCATTCA